MLKQPRCFPSKSTQRRLKTYTTPTIQQNRKNTTTKLPTTQPTTIQPQSSQQSSQSQQPASHSASQPLQSLQSSQSSQFEQFPTKPTFGQLKKKRWVITFGSAETNGLGRPSDSIYEAHPQRVRIPSLKGALYTPFDAEFDLLEEAPEEAYADISQISSGWTTSLVSTSEGRIFQWGWRNPVRSMIKRDSLNGKLGSEINTFFQSTIGYHPWSGGSEMPKRVPCFGAESIEQLRAEAKSSGMTVPDWMTPNRLIPVKIDTNADNRGVLTKGGHLFTWSDVGDSHGSLGLGRSYHSAVPPTMVSIPDVVDFAYGYNHLTFVTAQGTVYSSGNAENGASGLPLAFLNLTPKKKRVFRPLSLQTNYEYFIEDLRTAYRNHRTLTSKDGGEGLAKVITDSQPEKAITANRAQPLSVDYSMPMSKPKTEKIDLGQFQSKHVKTASQSASFISLPGFTPGRAISSHEAMRVDPTVLIANVSENVNFQGVEAREGAVDAINDFANGKLPEKLPKFKKVACGFAHTLLLDEFGKIWSMGRNSHGELGHTLNPGSEDGKGFVKSHQTVNAGLSPVDFRLHYFPQKIALLDQNLSKITKVSAGLHHSAVLTADNEIWTWGSNEYGQCGRLNELPSTLRSATIGHKQPWALPPGQLNISSNVLNGATIVDIECGFYDTAVTLSDGRCMIAGSFLSKEGAPRSLFSLKEFEKIEYEIEGEDSAPHEESDQTYIQSFPARDLIPRPLYSKVHPKEVKKFQQGLNEIKSIVNDQSYFMKAPSFGWRHIAALAVPRTYTDTPEIAYAQLYPQDALHLQPTKTASKIQVEDLGVENLQLDVFEVDPSLLGSEAAIGHFYDAENKLTTQDETFDSIVEDDGPFAKFAQRRSATLKKRKQEEKKLQK